MEDLRDAVGRLGGGTYHNQSGFPMYKVMYAYFIMHNA